MASRAASDGVDSIGLGAAGPWRPLGPGGLHQLLTVGTEEGGEARAVAVGALDGPAASPGQLGSGEAEQRRVAGHIGADRSLRQEATNRVRTAAARVSRWVSTPITPSTSSAKVGMWWTPFWVTAVVGVGQGGSTARQNCDESRPLQVGQAAYQANKRWARSTSAPRQTARPKATSVPVCLGVMPRCRRLSLTAILPDRRPAHSQFA